MLTEKGKPAFALVGVEDEFALEALTLGRNEKFMSYLDGVAERAKQGRTYSLKEIRAEFMPARKPRRKSRAARK